MTRPPEPVVIGGAPTRPALRYHGGKWRIAPWILAHFPAHEAYVEPFGGGGSILLRKPRAGIECYNDLDGNIVNIFRVLRDPVTAIELQRRVALTPFARAEFNWSYEPAVDRVDAAHKLIVRSFMGHGSDSATRSCRTGFRGKPTERRGTPATEWATWHEQIPTFCQRLAGVVIEDRDAVEVIGRFDNPSTLVYADPPYVHSTRSSLDGRGSKTHGYRSEMSDSDHEDLAAVLHACKSMVVLSGYPSKLYSRLYRDWFGVQTRASADMGKTRSECLWLNPAAVAARGFHQQTLTFDAATA